MASYSFGKRRAHATWRTSWRTMRDRHVQGRGNNVAYATKMAAALSGATAISCATGAARGPGRCSAGARDRTRGRVLLPGRAGAAHFRPATRERLAPEDSRRDRQPPRDRPGRPSGVLPARLRQGWHYPACHGGPGGEPGRQAWTVAAGRGYRRHHRALRRPRRGASASSPSAASRFRRRSGDSGRHARHRRHEGAVRRGSQPDARRRASGADRGLLPAVTAEAAGDALDFARYVDSYNPAPRAA